MLIDSHCHIHDPDFPLELDQVLSNAKVNDIKKLICIGVDVKNSKQAIDFALKNSSEDLSIFASVGVHPHEAKDYDEAELIDLIDSNIKSGKIVAIGEIGLDYHYNNSPKENQIKALKSQIIIALKYNLPISFHVRDAFDDFWSVIDSFADRPIKGVLHSFTDNQANLEKGLNKGFAIGINGISTFVKKPIELEMFNAVPINKIVLETDAPFLSPKGERGKPNQPAFINNIAIDLAQKRNLSLDKIAEITSDNSEKLFNI